MSEKLSGLRREDMPDGSVRIWFDKPILEHTDPKGFLTLRRPTVMEALDIGDPVTWVSDGSKALRTVDRALLIQWFRALAVGHDADIVGREPDLALGLLIEETILDFFPKARKRLQPEPAPASPLESPLQN